MSNSDLTWCMLTVFHSGQWWQTVASQSVHSFSLFYSVGKWPKVRALSSCCLPLCSCWPTFSRWFWTSNCLLFGRISFTWQLNKKWAFCTWLSFIWCRPLLCCQCSSFYDCHWCACNQCATSMMWSQCPRLIKCMHFKYTLTHLDLSWFRLYTLI